MGWNGIIGAGLLAAVVSAGAWASPACTTTNDIGSGGIVALASVTSGYCIQVDNVVYGSFNLSHLPSATVLIFNTNTVAGFDHIQLSFGSVWHNGKTYNWSYEVAIAAGQPAGTVFRQLDSDFDQTAGGVSILDKTTNPAGDVPIHLIKSGATLLPGSIASSDFPDGLTDFTVTEKLQDHGTIANVTNTVVVFNPVLNPPVPEPATLALMGAGLAGMRLRRRRKI